MKWLNWGKPAGTDRLRHNLEDWPFPPYLWMEEDLWPQEALIAHVDGKLLLADGVDAGVLLDPFGPVCVVLAKLFHQVWAHVTEALLRHREREGGQVKTTSSSIYPSVHVAKDCHHPATSHL